jgi:hypothetical protein
MPINCPGILNYTQKKTQKKKKKKTNKQTNKGPGSARKLPGQTDRQTNL